MIRFGLGMQLGASSKAGFGPDLWAAQNLTGVNSGVVNIIVSGSEWDVSTPTGSAGNIGSGGAILSFPGLTVGKTYQFDIDSDLPLNLVAYDGSFVKTAEALNSNTLTFVATAVTRLYVCPRSAATVRASNAIVREVL